MNLVIRADAALTIGNGHVMRCLTLAHALRQRGVNTFFLCRPLPGDLIEYLRSQDMPVMVLPALDHPPSESAEQLLAHWPQDAEQSLALLDGKTIDWLVVDHYGLDAQWHQRMRTACQRLLVLDDLANRPLDADVLIDQNPGRHAQDYDAHLPVHTARYIGPSYALLHPSFSQLREQSLHRRQSAACRHLLISMGGVDANNVTQAVLTALAKMELPADSRITVVLGPHAPWRQAVAQAIAHMPVATQLLTNTARMAELMCEADLAIGAAGTSALERCCMGLPCIQMVLANNQRTAAESLSQQGAAITVNTQADLTQALPQALKPLWETDRLQQMQLACAQVVDGLGVQRVLNEVMHVH